MLLFVIGSREGFIDFWLGWDDVIIVEVVCVGNISIELILISYVINVDSSLIMCMYVFFFYRYFM